MIVTLPTVEFSIGVGTVTISQTFSIAGSYDVSFGNGGVSVSHGGASETFSSDGTVSGAISVPGYASIALTNGGIAVTTTSRGQLGGDKVQVDTTTTFSLNDGKPPDLGADGGEILIPVLGVARATEAFCIEYPQVCALAGGT